jgi:transcriptional regulator with XRE-family HTH domain
VNENLGRRIAELRGKAGLTQQELAERLAVSRVTVSHLEAGLTVPGERTVALLASVFQLEPHELVAGTSYPAAKAERLPVVVARYTEVAHQLALLDNDLAWLEHVPARHRQAVIARWESVLADLAEVTHDERERRALRDARERLRSLRTSRHER